MRLQARRQFTEREIQAMADRARVDRRTILRRLAGLPVRGRAGRDADKAIAAHLGETTTPP
jgi:hypothetical protein